MNNNKIIVRNGSVIDGTGAAPVATSILIEGGKIAALGAAAEARSEGARVIDASGRRAASGVTGFKVALLTLAVGMYGVFACIALFLVF